MMSTAMKKLILAIAVAATCAGAMADNYIRLPVKGIHTTAGQSTTHPATSGLPATPGQPETPVTPADPVDDPTKPGVAQLTTPVTLPTWSPGMAAVEGQVTLKNTGAGALNITSAVLAAPVAAGSAIKSTTCGAKLSTTKECTYTVSYLPTGSGTRFTSLRVVTDGGTVTSRVNLNAIMGSATVTPTSGTFKNNGETQSITVTNSGSAPFTISGVALTAGAGQPGFTLGQQSNCLTTLAVGAACTFSASFAQSATADVNGVVTLTHDGGGVKTVSLTGWAGNAGPIAAFTGDASGNVKVNGGNFAFQDHSMTVDDNMYTEVWVINNGNKDLTFTSFATTGAAYSISGNSCGTSLSAGSKCFVAVKSFPKAVTNPGSFTITSDSRNGNLSFTLSGKGI